MCDWGDTVDVEVTIVAECSCTGEVRREIKPIDRCLSDVVRALDAAGVRMTGSCCGHGREVPTILLEDGTRLWRASCGRWYQSIPGKWLHSADPARRAHFEIVDVTPSGVMAPILGWEG